MVHENLIKASVRDAESGDASAIAEIYNYYVTRTIVTFEEEAVSASEMTQRLAEVRSAQLPWLVAEQDGSIVGYAYASNWKGRCAYRFSTEVTVYVASELVGRGLGSILYSPLLQQLKSRGIHTAMGGIALPNEASVALHEKFGFKKAAHFHEMGYKFNQWIDVAYWQRIL
jgi:L-amino acid N-acyltransferase YncA